MKAFLNWRYYVLTLLFFVGIYASLCELPDCSLGLFFLLFFLTRIIGVVSFFIFYKLFFYWARKNSIPLLLKLTK